MNKLKIFLSYHKDSPIYKSNVFQPIGVGGFSGKDIISDNTGENISELNPYYCELTGHYWVLKNYLDNCEEEYIGFAHYRRLPDLLNITEEDIPSVYGMKYSESVQFFKKLNSENLYEYCKMYDIIYPCRCYMYKNTVNPLLRETEVNYNVYEHFSKEHNNNCLDILKGIIEKDYPDFIQSMEIVYSSEKSLFYNIYIMRKDLLKNYLSWLFEVLEKVGNIIKNNYNIDSYKRMAGFVAETLTNIWLYNQKDLKIGHCPIYMIDFEADYIEKANEYHLSGKYNEEINELEKLSIITSDKFQVYSYIAQLYKQLNNTKKEIQYILKTEEYANSAEDYYTLAKMYAENLNNNEKAYKLYEKAIKSEPNEKFYALTMLSFAESIHDLEKTAQAWKYLLRYTLTEQETQKYKNFLKMYNMINQ